MSRVHDALRRVEQPGVAKDAPSRPPAPDAYAPTLSKEGAEAPPHAPSNGDPRSAAFVTTVIEPPLLNLSLLEQVKEIPFQPAPESHLVDATNPQEVPGEEFRSLRTRLNHLQTQQRLHTLVVTSPSPAEGKTFSAVNLALAESHLSENRILLADFDLRRPVIHNLFQTERSPGLSDYLSGQAPLTAALRRIAGTNLYLLPAGSPVKNPLELLNLRQVKLLFDELPAVFDWAIFDTPPLLFSADANLLATLADGTILVVKIGTTTFDNVTRAMQSLCENKVLGVVANGARASELYSKYTYYYSRPD